MFSRERCSAAPPVRCATRVHVRAWPSCTGAARLRMGRCCVLAHLTASTCESFRRYSKYIARAIYSPDACSRSGASGEACWPSSLLGRAARVPRAWLRVHRVPCAASHSVRSPLLEFGWLLSGNKNRETNKRKRTSEQPKLQT